MLETSGDAGKWTGARYVLVLDVALDIYSPPGFECEESTGACLRPQKDVEDPRESHQHSRCPSLASPLPKCETSNMERKDVLLEMVQLSLDRKYLVKGYSNLEYDLAMVVIA